MTKQVVLYVRVSTDEQAEKNLSLPSQTEKLQKFCKMKGWDVVKVFEEDYSAWHGFDRPAYNKLKAYIQENKKHIDYLLFIQWSRFSRNTAQAHMEIDALKRWGIEANATEQWVDMTIPESRYMLAFYLTAPQVENERLSLRVKDALRQGLKQGKWMGRAPYGYLNDKAANLIVPDPNTKDYVAFAFDTFAIGIYSIAEVMRMTIAKGASIQKQKFIYMLSNPLYVGKIYVKALGDEPATYVNGIHTPIVSEEVFTSVQLILQGKRKPFKGKTKGEDLPLKGHLICPECGKLMTGSASKGNGGMYHYYHCQRKYGCKNAYPAAKANKKFQDHLSQFKTEEDVLSLYYYTLEDIFKTNDNQRETERIQVEKDMENIQLKVKSLDDKMTEGALPVERYNRLVEGLESQIVELKRRQTTLSMAGSEFAKYIAYNVSLLADIDGYYKNAPLITKQKIVGSIYPENITFDGNKYRTNKTNEVFAELCRLDKGLKTKQPGKNARLSYWAPPV